MGGVVFASRYLGTWSHAIAARRVTQRALLALGSNLTNDLCALYHNRDRWDRLNARLRFGISGSRVKQCVAIARAPQVDWAWLDTWKAMHPRR